jgi:hypothetical protein
MIPVSNKTRSNTRVRYKHPGFQRQENTITILAATCWQRAQPSARSFAERLCHTPRSKRDRMWNHLAGRRLKRNLLRYCFTSVLVVIIILIICFVRIVFVLAIRVGSRRDCG